MDSLLILLLFSVVSFVLGYFLGLLKSEKALQILEDRITNLSIEMIALRLDIENWEAQSDENDHS